MKKFIITAVLTSLIAGTSFAQETVSSANVVGYVQTSTPAAGVYKMVALTQFSDGTTNTVQSINDLISNLDDLNADVLGSWGAGADKLHVYTGVAYNSYALFDDGAGTKYWADVNQDGWNPDLTFLGVNPTADTLARGAAIWYQTAAGEFSTNMISSGDVYLDDTFDVTVVGGYSLVSYPYSSDINLTNLVITGATGAGLGSWAVGADKIHIYTGIAYQSYALFDDGAGTTYWADVNQDGWNPDLTFLGVNPANANIEIGSGFWFETTAGKPITFNKIYTID